MQREGGFFQKSFNFFSSIQLAIFLIAAMVTVFAAGTLIESAHGADAARLLVYDTNWLEALLLLLVINLTASAFSRWPWQKKHVGFVLTHLGIIVILAGSWATQRWMLDAQMPIQQGTTEFRVTTQDPVLFLVDENETAWQIALRKHAFAWSGEEVLAAASRALPLRLTLLENLPKGRLHEEIVSSPNGAAALQVRLENSFMNQELWLLAKDAERSSVQMGPAHLVIADQVMEAAANTPADTDYLEFKWPDRIVTIPLKSAMALPAELALEGTPYRVRLQALYKNAMIDGKNLVEQPATDGAPNQAAVLFLTGADGEEKHTVFANYPDFPTQHGMKPSATGVHIYYRLPGGGSKKESHELRFVPQGGKLLYQIISGVKSAQGEVKTGQKIPTGWMDMTFRVNTFYPSAEVRRFFTPEPNTSQSRQAVSAVRVRADLQGESKTVWLGEQMPEAVVLGAKTFKIFFGRKRVPMNFKLTLRDFRVEEYPGTNRPASFESDVTLSDDFRGVKKNATISMNEPLVYRGVRIFQASYSRTPGEPDISVFAVGYDPGISVKYAGAVIMMAGILTMFYFRKYSTMKRFDE